MSYTLMPYVADLDEIRFAIGSKNPALLDAVTSQLSESQREEGLDSRGTISVAAALRGLIMGEPYDQKSAPQYGYALEALCEKLGERIEPSCWESTSSLAFDACGLDQLLSSGPPVDLPRILDFPQIGYIRRGDIRAWIEAAEARLEDADSDVRQLLEEFLDWLDTTIAKDKDIVFFYW